MTPRFVCSDCYAEKPLRRRPVTKISPFTLPHEFDTEDGIRKHFGWFGNHYPVKNDEVLIEESCRGVWSYAQ